MQFNGNKNVVDSFNTELAEKYSFCILVNNSENKEYILEHSDSIPLSIS